MFLRKLVLILLTWLLGFATICRAHSDDEFLVEEPSYIKLIQESNQDEVSSITPAVLCQNIKLELEGILKNSTEARRNPTVYKDGDDDYYDDSSIPAKSDVPVGNIHRNTDQP